MPRYIRVRGHYKKIKKRGRTRKIWVRAHIRKAKTKRGTEGDNYSSTT